MNIKNILCPTDFSTLSCAATRHASVIARRCDSTIHFVHVYEPFYEEGNPSGTPEPADLERLRDQLHAVRPESPDIEFCHEMIFGFPASALVNYANHCDLDLIVIGTHGRSGARRLLLGSVAETVMRTAHCPVLTIHHHGAHRK